MDGDGGAPESFDLERHNKLRYRKNRDMEEDMFSQSEDDEAGLRIVIIDSSSEEEQMKPKNRLEATRDDLSQQVYFGREMTGHYCPPVPTPQLYSSQPPVFIRPTLPQPHSGQRAHSSYLPHSVPQQGPEAPEIMQGNSTLLPTSYNTMGQGQALSFPQLLSELKKKPRTYYSAAQLEHLGTMFQKDAFPDREQKKDIAATIGVTPEKIKVWFQNHRSRVWKEDAIRGNYGHGTAGSTPHYRISPTLPTLAHSSSLTDLDYLMVSQQNSTYQPQTSNPTSQLQFQSDSSLSRMPYVPPSHYLPPSHYHPPSPYLPPSHYHPPSPYLPPSHYLTLNPPDINPASCLSLGPEEISSGVVTTSTSDPASFQSQSTGEIFLQSSDQQDLKRNKDAITGNYGHGTAGSTPQRWISPTLPTLAHSSVRAPPVSHWYPNPAQLAPVPPSSPTLSAHMAPSHSSLSSPGQSRVGYRPAAAAFIPGTFGGVSHPSHVHLSPTASCQASSCHHNQYLC